MKPTRDRREGACDSGAACEQLGWAGIVRLGLVQAMLGAVVVLTTSTLNRVMVVELLLPALVPGLLVALHYGVQLSRPRMGWGSDVGARRTPWIVGGMLMLASGGWLGAVATAWMGSDRTAGLALAVAAFVLVGLGVSACGTSLLTLLAKRVEPSRRASAAATVWVMMIVGFAVTAGTAGRFLDPYTPMRLVTVSGTVSLIAVLVTLAAVWRLEPRRRAASVLNAAVRGDGHTMTATRFVQALREVWSEPDARRFTVFVFVAMVAYSAQDLILEPFAGVMFDFTPGESTQLSGVQHGGTLAGMLLAALAGRRLFGVPMGSLRLWTVAGCVASCLMLAGLAFAGFTAAAQWPLRGNVFLLGVANGVFSIAAIGSMMAMAGHGRSGREGTRMGLWGAAQAIGFAGGGLAGTIVNDAARWIIGAPGPAYALVFTLEALMFLAAAWIAQRLTMPVTADGRPSFDALAPSPSPDGGAPLDARAHHPQEAT
jgi:MFS transporter, BCD family, chlorophyll transporter